MRLGPVGEAPRDLEAIKQLQDSLVLPTFTADNAFDIGVALRTRLRESYPSQPAVINITHVNSDQLLFHACSVSGTQPDNDVWVARKRRTVKRFQQSSWYMRAKFAGDEAAFATKLQLGQTAGEYSIHGGGVPVRVKGVEGIVAVIVVSGLKQENDHMIVVEAMQDFIKAAEVSP